MRPENEIYEESERVKRILLDILNQHIKFKSGTSMETIDRLFQEGVTPKEVEKLFASNLTEPLTPLELCVLSVLCTFQYVMGFMDDSLAFIDILQIKREEKGGDKA